MKQRKILILGATAALAHEPAKHFAGDGDFFYLVGRNPDKLKKIAQDLKQRGASGVETEAADLSDESRHLSLIQRAYEVLGGVDIVLIAHGVLSDQKQCEQNYAEAEKIYRVNFLSSVSLLTELANRMEMAKRGTLAVITSVAGDRPRASSYVYGSSKTALSGFLSGLRNRLFSSGVAVVDIRPGLIHTPMTAHLNKKLPFASAGKTGRKIYEAILKKKNVAYIPKIYGWMMLMVKLIPEPVFKRIRIRF